MSAPTQTESERETQNVGRIEEIQGVVIEAVFPDALPDIYNALEIDLVQAGEDEEVSSGVGHG